MDRRKFLKIAGLSGLSVVTPVLSRRARAAANTYAGPFYVLFNAAGGWDPVYHCDPKPMGDYNRVYAHDPMNPVMAGNIPYAPITYTQASLGLSDPTSMNWLMNNDEFFTTYADQLLVVNGINMETNNHLRGKVTIWSGRGDFGYPSLGALLAGAIDPGLPLAFISSGGYDATENLLPVTRLSNVSSFRNVAEPNRITPTNPDSTAKYHMTETYDRIRAAQAERLQGQIGGYNLPTIKNSANALFMARQGDDLLSSVPLPDALVDLPGEISDLERMLQQIQLALGAFEAGLAVAVNLQLGGFDTHTNHDRNQVRQLAKLFFGIDFLMKEAALKGLEQDLVIMVGSDFGRGKGYNGPGEADGKDHWPVGSAFFMGAGIQGNRVIGGTDDVDQLPLLIDPDTLAITEDEDAGVEIKSEDLHLALRAHAGIQGSDAAGLYPLLGNDFPTLLGG